MIKVLFFIHDLSGGGAEKVLVNLVNNMDPSKFQITVLTLFDQGVNKQFLNKNIRYKSVFKSVFRGNQHLLKIFSTKFLYKKMIPDDNDIMISYMQGATTRIISGNQKKNVKKINWIHTEMTKKKCAKSYRSYSEFVSVYNKYDATVFVSESTKEFFEKNTGLSVNNTVKYNTVESELIIQKSEEKLCDVVFKKDTINLIAVGSLVKDKGYQRLLSILKQLKKENYIFKLYILGTGPLKSKLEDYILENGMKEFVTFLGYKENPYKYIKNADLLVCSSYREGYSTVVTESLIVGTPVITTLCSGMKEILGVNNEYGLIVDNNKDALYKGLRNIFDNSNLLSRLKMKAQERSHFFSTKKTVKEVERFLMDIIQ